MNLSDFIDKLLDIETECRSAGAKAPVEIPVYVVDARTGDSNEVECIGRKRNVREHIQGELLDADENMQYIELGIG